MRNVCVLFVHNTILYTICKVTYILANRQQKKFFFRFLYIIWHKVLINNRIIGWGLNVEFVCSRQKGGFKLCFVEVFL